MSLGVDNASSAVVSVTTDPAVTLAVARPTRKQITFLNRDAANFVWIRSGATATADAAVCFKLLAGKQVTLASTQLWSALADTDTVVVSVMDEFE